MVEEYFEDSDLTPQSRWRWVAPIAVLVVLPLVGILSLQEMDGAAFWPSHNAELGGVAQQEHDAIGTSGTTVGVVAHDGNETDSAGTIRDVETITGLVDGHPLVGSKVDLHVPVAGRANDQAFWVGQKDSRVLVVPSRDHRDSVERQLGLVADHGIAALEIGKMAAISGVIQTLPSSEEMYGWGLTTEDREEAAALGVYLRADSVSVQ